jgi:hypothetical protein
MIDKDKRIRDWKHKVPYWFWLFLIGMASLLIFGVVKLR